jgi:hypothetical protein
MQLERVSFSKRRVYVVATIDDVAHVKNGAAVTAGIRMANDNMMRNLPRALAYYHRKKIPTCNE